MICKLYQERLNNTSHDIFSELDKTCDRYLRSQKAILSDEEYQRTELAVTQFRGGPGLGLQDQLKNIDKVKTKYIFPTAIWVLGIIYETPYSDCCRGI